MKFLSTIVFTTTLLLLSDYGFSQGVINSTSQKDHLQKVNEWRKQKDIRYKNPEKTMFPAESLKDFDGLKYYKVDYSYRVEGKLTKFNDHRTFVIQTTGGQEYEYFIYGKVSFALHGESLVLNVYQSKRSAKSGNKNGALFIPFTDDTSGEDTFGGGRYLVLDIPDAEVLTLDFNMAYNPYCVYDPGHSCPIPPKANRLKVKIEAGELMYP